MIEIEIEKRLNGPGGQFDLAFSCREEEGVFMSMFGVSGAGKTSILKMLCGLMRPDKGHIRFAGKTFFDSTGNIDLKPQKRDVGIVFQDYGLFPNMTARGNVEFALHKGDSPALALEMLDNLGLKELAEEKVTILSGGQQQRVALARTLVQRPSLLLLDEPFSATDRNSRKEMQGLIARLHTKLGLTTLLVSHDTEEVARLADVVYRINNGKVVASGKPMNVLYGVPVPAASGEIEVIVLDIIKKDSYRLGVVKLNDQLVELKLDNGVNKGDRISINVNV